MLGPAKSAGPIIAVLMLVGCAAADRESEQRVGLANFPLPPCGGGNAGTSCVAHLFADPDGAAQRDPAKFPARHLELCREDAVARECGDGGRGGESVEACRVRLQAVRDYLNPKGCPGEAEIGVALEGGGSKAAPFALGVLAGLQQAGALEGRVTAVSSVSGGSYAASYYFNRTFDRLKAKETSKPGAVAAAGGPGQWFRSCIPAYFTLSESMRRLKWPAADPSCREKTRQPETGEMIDADGAFPGDLTYMGHVWRNVDVMRGVADGKLNTGDLWSSAEILHYLRLTAYSLLSLPTEVVGRGGFRWPFNSSPTKLFYKLGLERQYGCSPADWAEERGAVAHAWDVVAHRRLERTLPELGRMVEEENRQGGRIPTWIVNTTAPSEIDLLSWLMPMPRDPLRQTFELTWRGYGSGTYGFARQTPESYLELVGRQPAGMPIVDAVVASAAFFDEDQTRKANPATRVLLGTGEKLLNQTWFTEIRNYNVGDGFRWAASALPLPLYFAAAAGGTNTPFIHLQDGGNAENSGIFSLLRRGYRTILYAHGTQDDSAEWGEICHLKNQLELDNTYRIEAAELDAAMAGDIPRPRNSPARFRSYLDGLCSSQLDGSDLAAFDNNYALPENRRGRAVAELFCRRLKAARDLPSHNSYVCGEFREHILSGGRSVQVSVRARQSFYDWSSRNKVVFRVLREEDGSEIAAIHPVVPGVSFDEFKRQVDTAAGSWKDWCALDAQERKAAAIRQCLAPDGTPVTDGGPWREGGRLPCIALANLAADSCRVPGSSVFDRIDGEPPAPTFPQDNFIRQTAHSSYTVYAAYFDLARQQTADLVPSRLGGGGGR